MKTYWITDSRYKYVGLILLIIWIGFMVFFYLKADEITKDPCSICAKRMGEEVACTTGNYIPVQRVYYPNGTIVDDVPKVLQDISDMFNFSIELNSSKEVKKWIRF